MNILEELKLSKRQNKHERYEYLCSQFNAIDYCIRLEKYTNKLQQENKKYKEVIDKAINDLNIILEIVREQTSGSDCWIIDRLEANKSILKEVSK